MMTFPLWALVPNRWHWGPQSIKYTNSKANINIISNRILADYWTGQKDLMSKVLLGLYRIRSLHCTEGPGTPFALKRHGGPRFTKPWDEWDSLQIIHTKWEEVVLPPTCPGRENWLFIHFNVFPSWCLMYCIYFFFLNTLIFALNL